MAHKFKSTLCNYNSQHIITDLSLHQYHFVNSLLYYKIMSRSASAWALNGARQAVEDLLHIGHLSSSFHTVFSHL